MCPNKYASYISTLNFHTALTTLALLAHVNAIERGFPVKLQAICICLHIIYKIIKL